jgi:hypothetical protein
MEILMLQKVPFYMEYSRGRLAYNGGSLTDDVKFNCLTDHHHLYILVLADMVQPTCSPILRRTPRVKEPKLS